MRILRALRALALLFTFGLVSPPDAGACSCVTGRPLCQTFWESSAVFSGEVVDIQPVSGKPSNEMFFRKRVTFRVLEAFRGVSTPTVDVHTGSGGGDCGYSFEKGRQYLVYAHTFDGKPLTTGICSPTKPLRQASDDLTYIRKTMAMPAAGGRIYGRVTHQPPPNWNGGDLKPAAGYTVTLEQEGRTRTTVSDRDGNYAFTGVAPGKYNVGVQVPATEKSYGLQDLLLPDARGCAAADLSVVPNGRIAVRILDAQGRPVPGLLLELLDLDADRDRGWIFANATAGADGRVEIGEQHPGRYAIAINGQRPPDPQRPLPTTFFPGVPSRARARAIDLAHGERVDLGDWRLPPALKERVVQGVLQSADGTPRPGTIIVSAAGDGDWQHRTLSDVRGTAGPDGQFTLKVLDGLQYEISALVRDAGSAMATRTKPVRFTAGATPEPVTIVVDR